MLGAKDTQLTSSQRQAAVAPIGGHLVTFVCGRLLHVLCLPARLPHLPGVCVRVRV